MAKAPTKTRVAPKPVQAGDVAQVSEGAATAPADVGTSPADAGGSAPDTALAGGLDMPPATLSANTPESEPRGGSGDPAAPAGEHLATAGMGGGRFPLTFSAMTAFLREHGHEAPGIRIISKVEGFRRGGRAHSKDGAEYELADFTPEQLEQIFGEANLVVELI